MRRLNGVEVYMHYTIGVPCLEMVHVDSMNSLFGLTFDMIKKGETFTLRTHKGSLVDVARNKITKGFLETDSDYLLFVDSDMVVPADGWEKLAEAEKDVIAGLCFQKYKPFSPAMYNSLEDGKYMPHLNYAKGDIIEADAVGTAFLLIKRTVLEKLKDKVKSVNNVPQFFSFSEGVGEDIFFCQLAKKEGFSVFCHTGVVCDHLSTVPIGEKHFEMFYRKLKQNKSEKEQDS